MSTKGCGLDKRENSTTCGKGFCESNAFRIKIKNLEYANKSLSEVLAGVTEHNEKQLKTNEERISELEKEAIEWKKAIAKMEGAINELEAGEDWFINKLAELKHDNSNLLMMNTTSIAEIKKLKD